jgi:hypothetical protein
VVDEASNKLEQLSVATGDPAITDTLSESTTPPIHSEPTRAAADRKSPVTDASADQKLPPETSEPEVAQIRQSSPIPTEESVEDDFIEGNDLSIHM